MIVASIGLGMGFEFVLGDTATDAPMHRHLRGLVGRSARPSYSSGLMAFLLLRRGWQRYLAPQTGAQAGAGDVIFSVEGMTCQHCVANVKNALQSVDEVGGTSPQTCKAASSASKVLSCSRSCCGR